MSRRWRNLRPRRGRYWNTIPQTTQAITPPPQFLRQAGPQHVPTRIRPSQRRRFDPAWTAPVVPTVVFTLGEPYFRWNTGTSYLS